MYLVLVKKLLIKSKKKLYYIKAIICYNIKKCIAVLSRVVEGLARRNPATTRNYPCMVLNPADKGLKDKRSRSKTLSLREGFFSTLKAKTSFIQKG